MKNSYITVNKYNANHSFFSPHPGLPSLAAAQSLVAQVIEPIGVI